MKGKKFLAVLFLGLIAIAALASFVGPAKVTLKELLAGEGFDVYKLRLLRIILAIVAGAGLAVAGVVFQALLRNPLAEPYLLGISSGASLGAVTAIVLGLDGLLWGIGLSPIFAFLGAVGTIILVYNLAKFDGRIPVETLILAGIVVGAVLSSMLMFLVSVSQNTRLHNIVWYLLGNLQVFEVKLLIFVATSVIIGIAIIFIFSRELNVILLGEEDAIHLGIDIELVKRILFCAASLITACIVAAAGIIGFVGLIVPHTVRFLVGPNHRQLIPASALSGAIFMVICDMIARVSVMPSELPVGVITAILGGPFFIVLLRKKRKIYFK